MGRSRRERKRGAAGLSSIGGMANETNTGRTRWAVLGPGAISRDFVVGLRASEHGVLHAVGSSSAERAASFAADHGAEDQFDGTRDVKNLLGKKVVVVKSQEDAADLRERAA